jgi:YD repeat-containing protein
VPSVTDLAPVLDNTNPNRIQEGNPDLIPNYTHSLDAFFNSWNALTGRFVWVGTNVILTEDAFSTATSYDAFGRTLSQTVNVDGTVSAFFYSGAGFPLLGRKIELRPGFNGSYNRFVNYINGSENVTDNYAATPSMDVRLNLLNDSLEINLNSSYSFNNAVSSLNQTETPFTVQRYGADFSWRLPLGFAIGMEGTYTKNAQPGEGFYDTEWFVLNAEISKRFLKTQNLEVALKGNDILNQNINARREVVGNVITDYRTTIISRYFLLKVTLRFNNRKTKEEDFNGWH